MAYQGKWWLSEKLSDGPPEEMQLPIKYTSPFWTAEISLNELWMGEKKFLGEYHVQQKNAAEKRKENPLGLIFNPDGTKK